MCGNIIDCKKLNECVIIIYIDRINKIWLYWSKQKIVLSVLLHIDCNEKKIDNNNILLLWHIWFVKLVCKHKNSNDK